MKIFASWSGAHSKRVATLLKTWLEDVLQGCTVWLSSENIEKGSVWFSEVGDTLKDTSFGVLCVTRENVTAPWILFEAGALSKGLTASRVSPLLIDLSPSDLKPPLALLNATLPTEEDMRRLVRDINAHSGDNRLVDDRLERAFRRCWPEFEKGFAAIAKDAAVPATKTPPKRPERELLEEISDMTKSVLRVVQDSHSTDERARVMAMQLMEAEKRMEMLSAERAMLRDRLMAHEQTLKHLTGRVTPRRLGDVLDEPIQSLPRETAKK